MTITKFIAALVEYMAEGGWSSYSFKYDHTTDIVGVRVFATVKGEKFSYRGEWQVSDTRFPVFALERMISEVRAARDSA